MNGFLIYAGCCVFFCILGIVIMFSLKPIGFGKKHLVKKIRDVRGYNRAMGKLFIAYGAFLLLCGVPTMLDINPILAMLVSCLGLSVSAVALFAFVTRIAETYKNGKKA